MRGDSVGGMEFEELPTTPTSAELLDSAYSRAARAGRAKQGLEAQQSMLQTASNILSDNLENVVTSWPDFDELDPFYVELADAVVRSEDLGTDENGGVDALRMHLSEISWASRKTKELGREYQGRLRGSGDQARTYRKQAFARMGSVLEEVSDDLDRLDDARNALRTLPEILPEEPAIVFAGYPNVGKSSLVNQVTNARNEVASYPFTTKTVRVGHLRRDHIRYQLIDTPGLLDRPAEERNDIESQGVSAITHLADCICLLLDPSGTCGYPLEVQLELRDSVVETFDEQPVLTVCNKADLSRDVEADLYMSVTDGEGVEELIDAAVEAIDYEPELPSRDAG